MTRPVRDLARRLNSATVHLMRALRQDADPSALAAEHRSALTAVVFNGPLSIGALARSERVGAPAMTKAVGVLEVAGLVTRRRDADDARVVRVQATRAGKELILRGRSQRIVLIEKALASLEDPDRSRLETAIGALERLVQDLEVGSASGGSSRPTRRPSVDRRAPPAPSRPGTRSPRARHA